MPDEIEVFKTAKGDDLVSQLLSHLPYTPEEALRESPPDPATAFRLAAWTEHLARVLYELSCKEPASNAVEEPTLREADLA